MFAAYPTGGIIATVIGKHYLEVHGWQILFFVAFVPLILIPLILKGIPESAAVLQKLGDHAALRKLATSLDPSLKIDESSVIQNHTVSHHSGAPITRLFQEDRAISTCMLWLSLFMGLFTLYALHSWLTKLMGMAGHTPGTALTFLLMLNIGAVVGSCLSGWLADKYGIQRVLFVSLIIGGCCIAVLAQPLPQTVLFGVAFMLGITVPAAQGLCFTYSSQFYPSDIRSTGIGMASGVGRIGGILAPMIIGVFISLNLPFEQNFYLLASAAILQAIAITFINNRVADFNVSRVQS